MRDDKATMLRETRKRDAKALLIIQQIVHDSIFLRIIAPATSKKGMICSKDRVLRICKSEGGEITVSNT